MNPTDDKKADVLLQLLDHNRKQAEWVKNLDFKVVYYCLGFFVASIGWFSANPPQQSQLPLLISSVVLMTLLSLLFLLRNHARHHALNAEFSSILSALNLMEPNHYGDQAVCKMWDTKVPWAFHFGRGLYSYFIICGAALAIAFVTSVAPKEVVREAQKSQNKAVEVTTNCAPSAP